MDSHVPGPRVVNRLATLCVVGCVALCAAVAGGGEDGEVRSTIDQLDQLWSERADPNAVERAISIGTHSFAEHPSSYELAWRLALLHWRKGDLGTDNAQRRDIYATARRYAETAVKLDPSRVEGHCYYALTTGDYGGTLSLVRAALAGIGSTFEREIKRAYEIDRDFAHGSPMLALGRYYFSLPWPKRDLQQSRRYLEELEQRHPGALLGRIYLADTDHALGDEAAARQELDYVLTHEAAPDRVVEEGTLKTDAEQRVREWFGSAAMAPDTP